LGWLVGDSGLRSAKRKSAAPNRDRCLPLYRLVDKLRTLTELDAEILEIVKV